MGFRGVASIEAAEANTWINFKGAAILDVLGFL